jgi:signal transduction histidine kinase
MQRRQFLSILAGAGVGSPLSASSQQESPVRTSGKVADITHRIADAQQDRIQVLSLLHEMRTPLNVVLGYSELILDNAYGETPSEMRVALHKVKQGGYRMAELINAAFEGGMPKKGRSSLAALERK